MKHWTQESTQDFTYHLSLDFFTQLQDRFEQSELLRKEFAEQVGLSAGRISQIFNNPPANPQLESLVRYAQALGLKVSIVAYDDGDPANNNGPVFSGVIAKCWEHMGKPRDLSAFSSTAGDEPSINWLKNESFNAMASQKKKRPEADHQKFADFNKAAGL